MLIVFLSCHFFFIIVFKMLKPKKKKKYFKGFTMTETVLIVHWNTTVITEMNPWMLSFINFKTWFIKVTRFVVLVGISHSLKCV